MEVRLAHSKTLLGRPPGANAADRALGYLLSWLYPSIVMRVLRVIAREGQTMSNRRTDLIYFVVFLLVVGFGYLAANRGDDDTEVVTIPDFSLPTLDLEVPFELPYSFVKFARPEPPKLRLSENMESVMVEVRSALLESSEPIEIRQEPQLAAVAD